LKRPTKKDTRALDAIMTSGKRNAFTSAVVSPPPEKRVRWDWTVEERHQE
jgi:hypothetical protein